jgi:hypothetical protein
MRARLERPSPPTLIATLALVLALSGGAWALPGRGKVDANDLAKGSVSQRALAESSVNGRAIDEDAVGRAEIASASIREAELAAQSVGSGELEQINQRPANVKVAAGKLGEATASCEPGERLLAGGATVEAGPDAITPLLSSGPDAAGTWTARIQNASAQEVSLIVTALCIQR